MAYLVTHLDGMADSHFFQETNHRIGRVQLQWAAFFTVCHDLINRKVRRLTCLEGFSIFSKACLKTGDRSLWSC